VKHRITLFTALLVGAVSLLIACATTDLVSQVITGRPPARVTRVARPATRTPERGVEEPTAEDVEPSVTPEPTSAFPINPVGTSVCSPGDNTASTVVGTITEQGIPIPGSLVQASSGPGGEPISDFPAVSDENGEYQVTFVCDNQACNGSFLVWVVDENFVQLSPFVQFIFDDSCRNARMDFQR
jgi:hypothetical protein